METMLPRIVTLNSTVTFHTHPISSFQLLYQFFAWYFIRYRNTLFILQQQYKVRYKEKVIGEVFASTRPSIIVNR